MKILIVGTVRNVASGIEREFHRLVQKISPNFEIEFFLVESDSDDKTVLKLRFLQTKITNFQFVSEGRLIEEIPDRIERLRHCRNRYVEYIRRNHLQNKWDFVLVMDFDGMNNLLDERGLLSCIEDNRSWDACFPVQRHGYYDLLALRHKYWMPENCFEELEWWKTFVPSNSYTLRVMSRISHYFAIDRVKREKFYSKMLVFNQQNDWIKVDSAFGGAAIYKTDIFREHDYSKVGNIDYGCEHVDLHMSLATENRKLYINPKFVNSSWNSYNLNKLFLVRLYRSRNLSVRKLLYKFRK